MDDLQDIVDVGLHPIDDLDTYARKCKDELQKNSILVLRNFLRPEALEKLQLESNALQDKAFFSTQNHNVLLTKKNKEWNDDHPCNLEVVSNKGCVPHDLIPENSCLKSLYTSKYFQRFLQAVLSLNDIHPYADTLSSINYNYYQEKQQLGWHFDNASFAVSLMIQSPESGGKFEYLTDVRCVEKNKLNTPKIEAVLKDRIKADELELEEGTLVLFYGNNYLHRVTPVTSKKSRILATLNYNLEKSIKLSENARLTFFGRLN
ncbi:MAG: 2OG-Fe(II) oxygenase [Nitrospinae bacterium]|nr:2OG-Fe(II) oxygenase [Nitrospinota bacterium]